MTVAKPDPEREERRRLQTEIGDITRFATPKHLVGYSGLCPRVIQSGDTDRLGPLTKHGPTWLRWALI